MINVISFFSWIAEDMLVGNHIYHAVWVLSLFVVLTDIREVRYYNGD